MKYTLYLAGEIHSDWRSEIKNAINRLELPYVILQPNTNHSSSDNVGVDILGIEDKSYWKDNKAAKINNIRNGVLIDRADVVIIRFGDKYRQWNTAFDAGYAYAKNKKIIVIRPDELAHSLKEIDSIANATCENINQTIEILKYLVKD